MGRWTGLLGVAAILATAFLLSRNRRAISWRIVAWGVGLQFAFAFLVLKTGFGRLFQYAGDAVNALLAYAEAGSQFLFGPLGIKDGPFGVVVAFQVLPIIIFVASLFSVLYYFGVMQYFVRGMAVLMQRLMRVSGAESTNVAASVFMGMTEAPLTIRPFLSRLTESELFTVMTTGMAHVAGSVMAAYVKIAGVSITHILTAVMMTAPASLMLSKILIPETGTPETLGGVKVRIEKPGANVIDAAALGAAEGVKLAINVAGMLIAFLALIALVNGMVGWVKDVTGLAWLPGSLEQFFGTLFAPVAWLLGVSWQDASAVGQLLGTRLVLNEFVAFVQLAEIKEQLSPHSFTIATYALCGFANFGSIAIQIGGIGALAPERRPDLARLGLRAVLAGTMANFMSASIAGMLL